MHYGELIVTGGLGPYGRATCAAPSTSSAVGVIDAKRLVAHHFDCSQIVDALGARQALEGLKRIVVMPGVVSVPSVAMKTTLLGIDVGTTGCKATLYSLEGQPLRTGYAEYPMQSPRPGWVEEDPEDWWQAVVTSVRRVTA